MNLWEGCIWNFQIHFISAYYENRLLSFILPEELHPWLKILEWLCICINADSVPV